MSTIKLWSLDEIQKLKKSTEWICIEDKFVVLVDCDYRCKRVWVRSGVSVSETGIYEEIDVKEMVRRISVYLSRHISLEKLLQDRLLHEPAATILDLNERTLKKGEVKQHKGCYYVTVKGKQGKPLQLDI